MTFHKKRGAGRYPQGPRGDLKWTLQRRRVNTILNREDMLKLLAMSDEYEMTLSQIVREIVAEAFDRGFKPHWTKLEKDNSQAV